VAPVADDSARLRTRAGRYAAECIYCPCPIGCACDGLGCPCGVAKPERKRRRDRCDVCHDDLDREAQAAASCLVSSAWPIGVELVLCVLCSAAHKKRPRDLASIALLKHGREVAGVELLRIRDLPTRKPAKGGRTKRDR